jgi:DNA-binding GntR family transcriptional regulator
MQRKRAEVLSTKVCLLPLSPPDSLAGLAYNALKETILSMDATTEGRLDERELAQSLKISRTPIRDAIRRLVDEGFLRVEPRKGVFVVRKTRQEIIEILYVRAALEGMAAKLAVRHVTVEDVAQMRAMFAGFTPRSVAGQVDEFSVANVIFHEFVLKLSHCQKLQEMAANIYDHMRMVRMQTIRLGNRARNALSEHLEMIQAFEKRDGDLAGRRMQQHIEGLARYVEENRGFFLGALEIIRFYARHSIFFSEQQGL